MDTDVRKGDLVAGQGGIDRLGIGVSGGALAVQLEEGKLPVAGAAMMRASSGMPTSCRSPA